MDRERRTTQSFECKARSVETISVQDYKYIRNHTLSKKKNRQKMMNLEIGKKRDKMYLSQTSVNTTHATDYGFFSAMHKGHSTSH